MMINALLFYSIIGMILLGPWLLYLADKYNRVMQISLFSTSLFLSIIVLVSVYFGFWENSYIGPSLGVNPNYIPSVIFLGIGIWILIPLSKRYISRDVYSNKLLFALIIFSSLVFIGHSTLNISFWGLYDLFGGTITNTGEGLILNYSASDKARKISCIASLCLPIIITTIIHFKRERMKIEVHDSNIEDQNEIN